MCVYVCVCGVWCVCVWCVVRVCGVHARVCVRVHACVRACVHAVGGQCPVGEVQGTYLLAVPTRIQWQWHE